jgi:hypothetical protein
MRVILIQAIPRKDPGKLQPLFMLYLTVVTTFFCRDGKGNVLAGWKGPEPPRNNRLSLEHTWTAEETPIGRGAPR